MPSYALNKLYFSHVFTIVNESSVAVAYDFSVIPGLKTVFPGPTGWVDPNTTVSVAFDCAGGDHRVLPLLRVGEHKIDFKFSYYDMGSGASSSIAMLPGDGFGLRKNTETECELTGQLDGRGVIVNLGSKSGHANSSDIRIRVMNGPAGIWDLRG